MLKRLLIAVFVLGLVLALSGTAFSGNLGTVTPDRTHFGGQNPSSVISTATMPSALPAQPAFKKPESAMHKLPVTGTAPIPPLDYFCDLQSYCGSNYYYWTIPDAYGDDLFNTRFTADANHDCSLKVVHYLMYWPATVGTPDFRAYIWADDGFGFPGAKLDSIDIPWATIDAAHTSAGSDHFFLDADFSADNLVFSDGENYHIGWTVLQGVDPTATLAIESDQFDGPSVGEARSSEFYSGSWGTMLNDYGVDLSFNIYAERCCAEIPYTDCYTQSYLGSYPWYVAPLPDPTYGWGEYSERFQTDGPETLTSVDVDVYNWGGGPATYPNYVAGSNDIIVTVYDDNAGLPGTQVAQVTLPAGTYAFYPTTTNVDLTSFNLIMEGNFHVGIKTNATEASGDFEVFLQDHGDGPQGHAELFDTDDVLGDGSIWWHVGDPNAYGTDYNVGIYANLCKDEYYNCSTQDYGPSPTVASFVPDANPITEYGQVFHADQGQSCILKDVTVYLYSSASDTLRPNMYTHNTNVNVYDAVGGTLLYQAVLTPADYSAAGYSGPGSGFLIFDLTIPDVDVPNGFMVGVESTSPTTAEGIRVLWEDGTSGTPGDMVLRIGGSYYNYSGDTGFGLTMDAKVCCIPFHEATCDPGADAGWSTLQGNQARTGASNLALGDSWCNLNLNWGYIDATGLCAFAGPIIYGDKIVCSFSDHFVVFDAATGAVDYTLTGSLGSGLIIGTGVRCSPTIRNIMISGVPTDVMFISGGSTQSMAAVNFNTGALIWERSVNTYGAGALTGQTRWATTVVLNVSGVDVMYYSTDNGKVVAVDAATGAKFNQTNYPGLGWPDASNPVSLTGATYISGATNGTNTLYYSTATAATEGDVYGIDAATGTINWTLSGAGGLQAQNIFVSYNYPEGFRGGVAYDNGKLYCGSYANDGGVSDSPTDGVYYVIDASNGNLPVPAVATNRVDYSTPIVDNPSVFLPTLSQWIGGTVGHGLIAYNKVTSSIIWTSGGPDDANYYMSGFRTCEPGGVDDQIFIFNNTGFLECWNSVTGDQIFRRRINHVGSGFDLGMAGAIADVGGVTHVAFADYYGGLYDFTQGADRPRLQFETYNPTVPVEFGANPALPVDAGVLITNTGCTDLNITGTTVDENPISGSDRPDFSAGYIPYDVQVRAAKMANDLARESFLAKFEQVNKSIEDNGLVTTKDQSRSKEVRRTAAGIPAWFLSLDHPTAGDVIAPGATMNLQFTVNQPLINRGPQSVYIDVASNDPDFFLNNDVEYGGALEPEIYLVVVGGCLIDTTELDFGIGQANMQWVTNNGRLGTGDWTPHAFDIDGDNASFYQGTYVWGVSQFRIAMNTQDWSSGGGEADAWISLQGDPNFCDNQCKPHLDTDVPVGSITRDGGATYDPLLADVVCKTYLDSVQNFDLGSGWDWRNFSAPFDDTLTMGLKVDTKTYGVKDAPEFANLTFEVMNFTERNGDSVPNWYMGDMTDYDVGSDTAAWDPSISAAWSYTAGGAGDAAWGVIKIPFGGCSADAPMINSFALNADSAQFRTDAAASHYNKYWDQAFAYMTMGPGGFSHANVRNGSDQEFHATIAHHSFGPNGTYKIGVVQFGLPGGVTNPGDASNYAAMANTVNKWAGFGRGDVNDDGIINIADIIYLAAFVNGGSNLGPIPFMSVGDVNNDGIVDAGDITYMITYYFDCGPCPISAWTL